MVGSYFGQTFNFYQGLTTSQILLFRWRIVGKRFSQWDLHGSTVCPQILLIPGCWAIRPQWQASTIAWTYHRVLPCSRSYSVGSRSMTKCSLCWPGNDCTSLIVISCVTRSSLSHLEVISQQAPDQWTPRNLMAANSWVFLLLISHPLACIYLTY